MIGATPEGSYRKQQGSRAVRVGIIDTGIDGSHPDIAPNFNRALSRNFTFDIPTAPNGEVVDGPCAEEADQSCADGRDVDDNGHGTHVAGTIGGALNGIGIVRRRPEGRAGQPARRPGLRLLLPAAVRRRADVRRRQRHRRREHVVLHRSVALQLRGQPGGLAGRAGAAAADHRGHAAGAQLRPRPRRDAGLGGGQRAHRPRQADVRRHQPGLPAGRRPARAPRRQQLPEHAARGQGRDRRSPRSARASARRSTPTTASSRPTCRRPAATRATRSLPFPQNRSSRRSRRRPARPSSPTRRPPARSSRRATTTGSGCRAPRWPRRTRRASRRWSWPSTASATASTAG